MKKVRLWAMVLVVGVLLTFTSSCAVGLSSAVGRDVPRLDKDTLKSWLSDPQVIILDMRKAKAWRESNKKIKGALRQDPFEFETWAAALPKDKKIVLYCA